MKVYVLADFATRRARGAPGGPEITHRRRLPDPVTIDDAVDVLAGARRPILLAGGGATAAGPALSRLAERLGAPTATTIEAHELFRGERFDLGLAGGLATPVAARTLGRADCLVLIGTGRDDLVTHGGELLSGKRIVRLEADDPALLARALTRRLDARRVRPSRFRSPALAAQIAWVTGAAASGRRSDDDLPPEGFLTDSLRLVRVPQPEG